MQWQKVEEKCFYQNAQHVIVKIEIYQTARGYPAATLDSENICWVFSQRCNVRDIQGTLREQIKEKYFLNSSRWKSCLCVKSVWLDNKKRWSFSKFQQSRSNVPKILMEHFTDVCFQNIPRISPEYCKVMKIILEVKKFKKLFCGLSCENVDIGSFHSLLLQFFSELYWNCFTFRIMFWKGSHQSLSAGKNS